MDKVTIADCNFLQYVKSASVGQDNSSVAPTYFEWELADAQTSRFVSDAMLKFARGEGQVAWLQEPFCLHPEDYHMALSKKFDYVLTHNRYFVENYDWLWYPFGGSWIDFNTWKVYKKSKNISMILSEKNSLPGHKLRHQVAQKYAGQISIFGLESRVRKFDALADFRYSIVIQAERSFSFFNEALIDCISVGTIPIYWGCPDIGTFFDPRGMIQVENIDEIESNILYNDATYYKSCLPAIKENIERAKKYRIVEDWIYNAYPFLFKEK